MGKRIPATACLACLLSFMFAVFAPQARAESIVPRQQRISGQQARLFLAEFLWRGGDIAVAGARLAELEAGAKDSPELLLEMASLQARMGHAAKSRSLFARALPLAKDRDKAELLMASAMNVWGDYYRMEKVYRGYLMRHPNDFAVRLDLARLFMAAQRFEDSEGALLLLLRDEPGHALPILESVCELKWREKDLAGCLKWCARLLAEQPGNPTALEYGAQAYQRLGRLDAAADSFASLAEIPGHEAAGWTGLGRVRLSQGRGDEARRCLSKALTHAAAGPEADFLLQGEKKAVSEGFLKGLTAPGFLPPDKLAAWAEVYREGGHMRQAEACYGAALAADPDYFPARMALSETLGIARRYDAANRLLAELNREFGGVSKIMLTRARVLAWSEHYAEALDIYRALHRLNPEDNVPLIEAARTAAWAKEPDLSHKYYSMLWQKPVSAELKSRLARMDGLPRFMAGWAVEPAGGPEPPYRGYEEFQKLLAAESRRLGPARLAELERLAVELRPAYRVQKEAYLEMAGKEAVFNNRPLEALDRYRELVEFRPGNQEALFGLGQAQCALGLCGEKQKSYAGLLKLDPLHGRARVALKRARLKENPLVHLGYSAWSEDGRGEAARITRHRADAGVTVPLACRWELSATAHQWWEMPHRWGGEQTARGFTLEAAGRFSPTLEGRMAWTRKSYEGDDLSDLDLGRAELGYRLRDYAILKLGWNKEDVVKNAFSLREQITRQQWWLSVQPNLGREWEADLAARFMDYSDDNQGVWAGFKLARLLSGHPSSLKLELLVDYRDYQHKTEDIYRDGKLADMKYPYWSPRDWLGANLALAWRRDYSALYICGGETRYYEIRLTTGTDTEGNVMAALEAAWHHEFAEQWAVDARGLVHRSREWDANGVWLYLSYRF